MDKFYIYFHLKQNTDEIFYVGKGFGNRAYSNQRSIFWKRTVSKYGGFTVKIVEENLTEFLANEREKYYIAKYGRRDNNTGILVNHTDGGDGSTGRIFSVETRKRMSNNRKGKSKGSKLIEEKPVKILKPYIKKHPNGYVPTEETRNKIRKTLTNRKSSVETRKKQSDSLKGKSMPTIICPNCLKSGGTPAMKRWHFDNCKLNKFL